MLSASQDSSPAPVDNVLRERTGCIAAASFRNNTFGAVYFDDESGYIRVLEDMFECDSPNTLIQRTTYYMYMCMVPSCPKSGSRG
jgi:hypothetical protein